jgi:hypothetical protein
MCNSDFNPVGMDSNRLFSSCQRERELAEIR